MPVTPTTPPPLGERWERFQTAENLATADDPVMLRSFALRGDRRILIFDDWGWFTLGWEDNPTTNEPEIIARDSLDRTTYERDESPIYCEPTWLSVYYEHFEEQP